MQMRMKLIEIVILLSEFACALLLKPPTKTNEKIL